MPHTIWVPLRIVPCDSDSRQELQRTHYLEQNCVGAVAQKVSPMCLIWRKADCSPSGLSVQQVIERNLPISTGAGDESSLRTQQQPERTPSKQTTSVCYFHLHILLMVSFVRYKLSVCPANCCCRVESQRLRRCYVGGERVDFWTCRDPPAANHAEN